MLRILLLAALLANACSPSLGGYPCTRDTQCPTGSICDNGSCKEAAACSGGQTLCHSCVDLQTDVVNCGGCDHACPTDPNGAASCSAGGCALTCNAGFAKSGTACIGPPAAPTGLVATGAQGHISLTWNTVTGADAYRIRRGSLSGQYTNIDTSSGASYTDNGVAAGATYFYVVRGFNAAGDGPDSNESSAQAAPAAPTNLVATGGAGQVTLTWTASPGASSYDVGRAATSGGPYTSAGTTQAANLTDTGRADGTTYFYTVTAGNSGGASGPSSEASATTRPPAPTSLAATGGDHVVQLTWNRAKGATSYDIFRAQTSGGEIFSSNVADPGSGTTVSVNDPIGGSGQTWFYQVHARNAAGMSDASNEASGTTFSSGPGNVTALGDASQIKLTWDTTGAGGYNVYRSNTGTPGTFTRLGGNPTTTGTTFTDITVGGAAYYYGVSSVNGGNESGTTQIAVPAVPVSLSASSLATGEPVLTWTPSAAADSYIAARGTVSGSYPVVSSAFPDATYTDASSLGTNAYYYQVRALANGIAVRSSAELVLPGVPTGLTADNPSGTNIHLSWTGAAAASSYNVLRNATQIASAVAGTTYTDTDASLNNATNYSYQVISVGAAATRSSLLAVVIAAPTWLTSTGTPTSMPLAWNQVPSAGSYSLYRATAAAGPYTQLGVDIPNSATPTATDGSLTGSQEYWYQLRSNDAIGSTEGMPSTVHVAAATAAPTLAGGHGGGQNQVVITNSTAGVAGVQYMLVRDDAGPVCQGLLVPQCTDTLSLSNTGTYVYQVYASTDGLLYRSSDPRTLPPAPTWKATVSTGSTINLAWNAVGGASTYPVDFRTTSTGSETHLGDPATTSTTDATLPPGSGGYYVVRTAITGATSLFSDPLAMPPVPGTLVASGNSTTIQLSWTASSIETGYTVERGTASGSYGAAVPISAPTVQYTDTTGISARSFYYRVSAVAGLATRLAPEVAVPSVRVVSQTSSSPTSLGLSWTAGTETTPVTLSAMQILHRPTGGTVFSVAPFAGSAVSGTDNGLTGGTAYDIVVQAVAGNAFRTTSIQLLPEAPVLSQALGQLTGSISVAWGASAHATSYKLVRDGTAVGSSTASTSASDAPGDTASHAYGVRAFADLFRDSAALTVPAAPAGFSGFASGVSISLSWTASSGATGYSIFRSNIGGTEDPASPLATNVTGTTYTDNGLTPGSGYFYVAQATAPNVRSLKSVEASATAFIAAPTGLAGSQSAKNVRITWQPAPGATSYIVSRSDNGVSGTYNQVGTPAAPPYAETLAATGAVFYKVVATDGSHPSAPAGPLDVEPRQYCVVNANTGNIELYDETQTTGSITPKSTLNTGGGGGGGSTSPWGLVANVASQRIFVMSNNNFSLTGFPMPISGTPSALFSASLNNPNQVSEVNGLLYVSNSSGPQLQWFSEVDGTQVGFLQGGGLPSQVADVALDPLTNELFVASTSSGNNLQVYDFGSMTLKRSANTGASGIIQLALDPPNGKLYTLDGSRRVSAFAETWTGTSIASVGQTNATALSQPRGMSVDPLGGVVRVVDSNCSSNQKLQVFSLSSLSTSPTTLTPTTWQGGCQFGARAITLCN